MKICFTKSQLTDFYNQATGKNLQPLAQEATKWSELQKTSPELFNTGILRKSQAPYKAVGEIPVDVHTAQYKWQNYGQSNEIPADVIYKRIDSGSFKGEYVDKQGDPIRNADGSILQDIYNEITQQWEVPTISNEQLKNNLLDKFSTKEGKNYLNKVVEVLPKNPDGTITAYRIGAIGEKGTQSYTLSEGMAKTFSNQGTDILPAGTPGLPKGGYKDFGVLPANIVRIDPKGIKAWSPFDAEILVEPKYVKTKSQLTDFYNQANKVEPKTTESVKVSRSQLPVGTGKTKVSGLEARIKGRLDALTPEEQVGISTYQEMNKAEQIKSAVEYVSKNPNEAIEVLKGNKPAPKGLLNNSIFLAMEEQANNDTELALKLASLRSTRAGQEISILTERDPFSPVKYMADLQTAKIEAIGGREKLAAFRDTEVRTAKRAVSINRLQKTDWNAFIDSITC